ncbi:MAG TPA: GNAT family N-acetyltransferase [Roseiflexaceae bacterium]|nr:GNAT family N-acetyltransferase [Roseiflexaceae bacterium]
MNTPNDLEQRLLLRDVSPDDLPIFFAQQQDAQAIHMAAFTSPDPADRAAFDAHWSKIMANPAVVQRTIVVDGEVAGNISRFEQFGEPELSYWLGREHWGRGVATAALAAFLRLLSERPLYARVVKDNIASRRVLEKCGFAICGEDKGFAHGRGAEVEEFILRLDGPAH